jgi:hypothetical protein
LRSGSSRFFLNMARELQEHRTTLRQLENRIRDMEEARKLLAQEQRHAREVEAAREKNSSYNSSEQP